MTSSVMAERRRLRKALRNAILVSMAISSRDERVLPFGDAAVAQAHAAPRARHDGGVVRGEDERRPGLAIELFEKVEDVRGRVLVEVRGRLVGEDELRLGDPGPGDGDALPLPTRELVGALLRLRREPDVIEPAAHARVGLAAADVLQQQRVLDVLVRGEDGDEVEGLEEGAKAIAGCGGEAVQRDGGDVDTVAHDAGAARLVDAADEVEQRGLAAAGDPETPRRNP